jgi:hypothetical protein
MKDFFDMADFYSMKLILGELVRILVKFFQLLLELLILLEL